jgi:hypothetical protein
MDQHSFSVYFVFVLTHKISLLLLWTVLAWGYSRQDVSGIFLMNTIELLCVTFLSLL